MTSRAIKVDREVLHALGRTEHERNWNQSVLDALEIKELEKQLAAGGLTTNQVARLHGLKILRGRDV